MPVRGSITGRQARGLRAGTKARRSGARKTQARQPRRRDGGSRSHDDREPDGLGSGRTPPGLPAAGWQRRAVHQPGPGDRRGGGRGAADHSGLAAARPSGRGAAVCDGGEHAGQQAVPPLPEPGRLHRPVRGQPGRGPRGGVVAAQPGLHRHSRRRAAQLRACHRDGRRDRRGVQDPAGELPVIGGGERRAVPAAREQPGGGHPRVAVPVRHRGNRPGQRRGQAPADARAPAPAADRGAAQGPLLAVLRAASHLRAARAVRPDVVPDPDLRLPACPDARRLRGQHDQRRPRADGLAGRAGPGPGHVR